MKRPAVDAEDAFLFGGLALLAAGLAWHFSPAVALMVVGAVAVVMGIVTAWAPARKARTR